MSDVISELMVVLGLKDEMSSGISSAESSVAGIESTMGGLESSLDGVESSFASTGDAAAAGATGVSEMGDAAAGAADGIDEMGDSAANSDGSLNTLVTTAAALTAGVGLLASGLETVANRENELDSAGKVLALQTGETAEAMEGLIMQFYTADTSMEEAAAMFQALGKAGVTSAADLEKAGTAFDTLADAVGAPGDKLTEDLIPAFKAFGIELTDADQYIDGLATMFQKTGVDSSDFGRTIQRLGPEIASAGLSMEDLETAMVAMSEAGYTGRSMMSELSKAVSEGSDTNGDGKISFEELTAAMGLSGDAIDTARGKMDESAGSAKEFADAMNIAATGVGDDMKVALDKLVIGFGDFLGPFDSVIGAVATFAPAMEGIGGGVIALQALGSVLPALSAGSIVTGLSGLAGSIGALGATMTASLIPALIAAAPIILGVAAAIAILWALNELGVFDWIIEQGAAFAAWIQNFDVGAAFQGVIDFFTGLPGMIMDAITGGGGGVDIPALIAGILFPPPVFSCCSSVLSSDWGMFEHRKQDHRVHSGIDRCGCLAIVGHIPPCEILSELGIGLDV